MPGRSDSPSVIGGQTDRKSDSSAPRSRVGQRRRPQCRPSQGEGRHDPHRHLARGVRRGRPLPDRIYPAGAQAGIVPLAAASGWGVAAPLPSSMFSEQATTNRARAWSPPATKPRTAIHRQSAPVVHISHEAASARRAAGTPIVAIDTESAEAPHARPGEWKAVVAVHVVVHARRPLLAHRALHLRRSAAQQPACHERRGY